MAKIRREDCITAINAEYEASLHRPQINLEKFQRHVIQQGHKVPVILDGEPAGLQHENDADHGTPASPLARQGVSPMFRVGMLRRAPLRERATAALSRAGIGHGKGRL